MACHSKLLHLGLDYTVRRSTLSDANHRRDADVFADIYQKLYQRYAGFLSDSRPKKWRKMDKRTLIMDSTTMSLSQEILKAAGRNPVMANEKVGSKPIH